jgi:dTDP-3-amino-3,4,6-trideoxy-alpha-D-glucose transaminase
MPARTVPFGDLAREYAAIRPEVDAAVLAVLARGRFVLGEEGEHFERELGTWLGAAHVVGCASGTEAITLALLALGIGPGDEVLLPANTCVPTAAGIRMTGATPVPVDVDPATLMLDPALARRAVGTRTRAIVPVHLYGAPADLGPLLELGIPVVEDCAQAHGARYRGRVVGTIGTLGCFSFYPSKNLGAYGDAGAVVTADATLADRVRMLRQYGQKTRYEHEIEGINSRLDEIQAAVLRVKLRHLEGWNRRRRTIATRYGTELRGVDLPRVTPGGESVHHLFPVLTDHRDRLMAHCTRRGITTLVHYPIPLHLQPSYRSWNLGRGTFPVAERAAERILSLPLFPHMTDDEVAAVIAAVRERDA